MTVTYTGQVANAKLFAFSRLLFYWKGSIYKLMYKEMLFFVGLYTIFSLAYRLLMMDWQKRVFEKVCLYVAAFTNLIPLSFVLGFYIAIVVTRWWSQFMSIPWPDRLAMYITTVVDGFDEKSRLVRRTIMRYLMLASLTVFQATSVSVKKRFPTMDHLVEAGVVTQEEVKIIDHIPTPHGKWWVPFVWCLNILNEARHEGTIRSDYMHKALIEEVLTYRGHLGLLYSYDWISIPLVYTQVTTLAVYVFFLGCVFGRQFLDPEQGYPGHDLDMYIPVFTLLQFFFYMGWLKVAEQMINPFGEDDDDFDLNWIVDRNMQMSFLVVDDLHGTYPKMEKDMYWDEVPPEYLPYTISSVNSIRKPHMGSTVDLGVKDEDMKIVNPMETIEENATLQLPTRASRSMLQVNSNCGSPLSSPTHTRRMNYGNLIASLGDRLKPNLSLSKSTLEGLKIGTDKPDPRAVHVNHLGHSSISVLNTPVRSSYLEGWLNDPNSRFEVTAATPGRGLESRNNVVADRNCATPPVFAISAGQKEPRTAVNVFADVGVQNTGQNTKTEATSGRKDGEMEGFMPAAAGMMGANNAGYCASLVEHKQNQTIVNSSDTPNVFLSNDEVPEVVVDLSRTSSLTSDGFPQYEGPDSTHSTVTSITPLLKASEQSDLDEVIVSVL